MRTTINTSGKTASQIYSEAKAAGFLAATEYQATLPPEGHRGLDCGFAWVIVRPARGPFVTWCKNNQHGRKGYEPGWHFWYSEFSIGTQSVSVHEKAAEAFAAVLRKHGIEAHVGSRLD